MEQNQFHLIDEKETTTVDQCEKKKITRTLKLMDAGGQPTSISVASSPVAVLFVGKHIHFTYGKN